MTTSAPIRRTLALATTLLLGAALVSTIRAGDREASQHYRKGLDFLQAERWDDAIVELKAAAQERARPGYLRIGMFQEKYFPYYHLGRAHLAKGDKATAITYFDREESEGEIQRLDRDLFERLVSERRMARGSAPAPTPGPIPISKPTPTPLPSPGPVPSPGPGPVTSPIPGPAIEKAREETLRLQEEIRALAGSRGPALAAAAQQKLASLDQALSAALKTDDAPRVVEAQRKSQQGLAEVLMGMADAVLKDQRSFMSQDKEREMRELSARLRYALAGDDRQLVQQLGTDLNQRVTQARGRIEQAYSAVRTAFARSAAGERDQAIQTLEEAVASQPDDPALRLILARFCFERSLNGAGQDGTGLAKAREQAAQAFRLRPNLSFPKRYFPPPFLDLVREVKGAL
jgi:tetratricopeptide (TPR) repeat protein